MNTTKKLTDARDFCIDCGAPTHALVWSLDENLDDIEVPVCIDCADDNIDGWEEAD